MSPNGSVQNEVSVWFCGLSAAQLLCKQAVSRNVFTPGRGLAFWWEAALAGCLLLLKGFMFGPFCPVVAGKGGHITAGGSHSC